MNRKRVMEARARKFQLLRKDGKSKEEAAKLASINPETAVETVRIIVNEKQKRN